jgi:hypothetical protein
VAVKLARGRGSWPVAVKHCAQTSLTTTILIVSRGGRDIVKVAKDWTGRFMFGAKDELPQRLARGRIYKLQVRR